MGLAAVRRPVSAFIAAAALFFLTSLSGSLAVAAAPPQPTLPEILLTDIDVKDTKDNIRVLCLSCNSSRKHNEEATQSP